MKTKQELLLLNRIKTELPEKGDLIVTGKDLDCYTLIINAEDWHNIFKTDEYNAMIKKEEEDYLKTLKRN